MGSFQSRPLGESNGNRQKQMRDTMVGSKRSYQSIQDMTQDGSDDNDHQRASKISRSSYQHSSPPQPQPQSQPQSGQSSDVFGLPSSSQGIDLTGDDNDDDDSNGNETMYMTQADQMNATETYEQYGVISTKVVGIRYYAGMAARGESVILRREPHNRYDRNAIQVLNVRGEQVGHVPRQIAAKLASYMDLNELLLEAILSGHPGSFDIPLSIKTFGPSDVEQRQRIRARMNRDRLPTDELRRREQEEKRQRAMELKRAARAEKAAKKQAQKSRSKSMQWANGMNQGGLGANGIAPEEDLEDIANESRVFNPREMGQAAEKFGASEEELAKMVEADQPQRLATKMLPYQRQGLAWLLEKEDPRFSEEDSNEPVQLWMRRRAGGGNSYTYTNIATNFNTRNVPNLARGGILADDMGLGKTLEVISLILADKQKYGERGPTLVVAPVSVMSNWSQQAERHVDPKQSLRVYFYHGSGKNATMEPHNFGEYDMVITTYASLSMEYLPRGNKIPIETPTRGGLYSVQWRRVILDEGHNIRNPNTKNALAACALYADAKWALTGTPIVNSLKDLYSLIRYIGLTGGLEQLELFNALLTRPMRDGQQEAALLLQALMSTFCLRRRKDMQFVNLKLPELREYVHHIKFPEHERKRYDALQEEAKGTLDTYKAGAGKESQNVYRHLLEVLLRLRQVCNHWKLCEERVNTLMDLLEKQKIVDLTPENRRALQDLLQLSIEQHEDCPVCLDTLRQPVITHCGHVFDNDCITRVIETQHKCPMCRAEIRDETKLVPPAVDCGDDAPGLSSTVKMEDINKSAKTQALLKILTAALKKPGSKVVVFSQWCRFLDLVQPHIAESGYGIARVDGSMTAGRRDAALRAFDRDDGTRVMLASLGVCAVGLNLVAADTVILCDSWWAPAIEDQAVDRVHRLGQTKPTTVWRLVMEDSVEERTLDIQQDKRKLMATALKEGPTEKTRREGGRSRTLGDIERLFGATNAGQPGHASE